MLKLMFFCCSDTKITLSVKTMNGHTHSVKINTSDQVLTLKSRLFDLSGVSVDSQTVIYMGKPLENNKYMKDYKVRDGKIKTHIAAQYSRTYPPSREKVSQGIKIWKLKLFNFLCR